MKKSLVIMLIALLAFSLVLTGCKKAESPAAVVETVASEASTVAEEAGKAAETAVEEVKDAAAEAGAAADTAVEEVKDTAAEAGAAADAAVEEVKDAAAEAGVAAEAAVEEVKDTAAEAAAEAGAAADTAVEEVKDAAAEVVEEAKEAFTTVSKDAILFGTNAEFPPFEFVAAEGVIDQYDGIDMGIAKEIAEANGMTARIENMEFDGLLAALQSGKIDAVIAGMTVTEERAEAVNFTTPYYTATQVMIVPQGSEIKTAADMADKKIVVIQGYTGEQVVKELGYSYEAFKKGSEAILELTNGKCDVVVIDSATAAKYVADNENLTIVEDVEAFGAEEYAIAVNKNNPELLAALNSAIEKMLADGRVSEIAAQYN